MTPLETSQSGAAAVQGQRHAETGEDQGRGVGDRGFQRGGDWQVAGGAGHPVWAVGLTTAAAAASTHTPAAALRSHKPERSLGQPGGVC